MDPEEKKDDFTMGDGENELTWEDEEGPSQVNLGDLVKNETNQYTQRLETDTDEYMQRIQQSKERQIDDLTDTTVEERKQQARKRARERGETKKSWLRQKGETTIKTACIVGAEAMVNLDKIVSFVIWLIIYVSGYFYAMGWHTLGSALLALAVFIGLVSHQIPKGWITEMLESPPPKIKEAVQTKYQETINKLKK